MFKKLNREIKESLSLHVAGATVRHESPFSGLEVFENNEPISQEFINKYISPFYLTDRSTEEFREKCRNVVDSVDEDIVIKLLGDFNWRSRSVGAYFAALLDMKVFEGNIGNLLLRSDVCYAGSDYCLALASFSSPEAVEYLNQYLEYYLNQHDLWFDQNSAMGALSYIGSKNKTDLVSLHLPAWNEFIANKPNWDLLATTARFAEQMSYLDKLKLELK